VTNDPQRKTGDAAPARLGLGARFPLWLLLTVNARQSSRRALGLWQQSRWLSLLVVLFLAGYLGLAFLLFAASLRFVGRFPGLGTMLLERLFYLMFGFLFVLLLLSHLVISYTNFFRNRETAALLTLPVSTDTIFQWKFIESALLASWAFIFLIAPFLVAYGLTRGVPWHFYLVTVGMTALFIILPGVTGAWAALLIARYVDRRVFQVAALLALVGLLVAVAVWLKPEKVSEDQLEFRVLAVLDRMMDKTRLAQFPFLPSYWLSASVLNWAEGAIGAAVFFMLVLLSYVLFVAAWSFTSAGRFFYEAASAVQSRGGAWHHWRSSAPRRGARRAEGAPGPFERLVDVCFWMAPDVRALLVKDARMFWRDTTQWGQSVVLFGLLGVYIINLRHFSSQLNTPFWTHLVAYLNLAACSLNLATLTTRFVYPMFSLEGKRLWIVEMAPLGLARVVRTKFHLSLSTALVLTLCLIWLSCQMLELPWPQTIFFTGAIGVMTFTLTGLAMGLGILYPNFREDNPGKIVSGFGGTFCLILSFLYIVGSVALLGFGSPWTLHTTISFWRVLACLTGFAGLSIGLGWLPLQWGLRRLDQVER